MDPALLAERYFGGDRESTGPETFDELVALLEEYGESACDQLSHENSILKSNVSEARQECARLDSELKRFTDA